MKDVNADKHTLPTRHRRVIICLFLVLATCSVYWQVINHEFINLDDKLYVVMNQHVTSGLTLENTIWAFTTFYASNWHPITWLSHMLDCQVFGLNPGMHHLINMVIHIINSILLFLIFSRMTGMELRSALVAFLFALHPLHVESVAWVAERKDVLSTFFWMLTMWYYYRYVSHNNLWNYIGALGFFVMGLMAKPMLVTLPFVLLLLDYWPLDRLRLRKEASPPSLVGFKKKTIHMLVLEKLPFFVFVLISSFLTILAQKSGGAVAPMETLDIGARITNAVVSYATYILKMAWPFGLAVFYPFADVMPWWKVLGAGFLLILMTAGSIVPYKRFPFMPVGWLWFLGTLVPVIGIVQVGLQSMADRYTYVPLIGIFVMIAWGMPEILKRYVHKKVILTVSSCAVVIFLIIITWIQIGHWRNDSTLSLHAIEVTSDNYLAYNNLGLSLEQEGKIAEAVEKFENALKIHPDYVDAHVNIGLSLSALNQTDEAMEHYRYAIRIRPDMVEPYVNLGGILVKRGMLDDAANCYENALRIKPGLAEAHNGLGVVFAHKGDVEGAEDHFRQVLRIDPNHAGARSNLERLMEAQKGFKDAVAKLREAIDADPDNTVLYVQLGDLYRSRGSDKDAIEYYERALELEKRYVPALSRLSVVYGTSGEDEKALDVLLKIVEVRPESAEVYYNIACIYSRQDNVIESIRWLNGAVDRGFVDWDLMRRDKDLDNIRGELEFKQLMEKIK